LGLGADWPVAELDDDEYERAIEADLGWDDEEYRRP
jgi:hypothetical protein